jgi:hypothetical protein
VSTAAGSGEIGKSFGRRFRRVIGLVGLLGYLVILLALFWVTWDADERSWTPADLPGWFIAPSRIVPESLQHEAARAVCYFAVLANSQFESGYCPDAGSNPAGAACFSATKNTWCADEAVVTSTAVWLLLGYAGIALSTAVGRGLRSRDLRPPPTIAEEHGRLKSVFLNGALGIFMFGWAYQALHLGDVLIFKAATSIKDAVAIADVLKSGCAVRTGHCMLDISSKAPLALIWIVMGFWMLIGALLSGYRLRHAFSQS